MSRRCPKRNHFFLNWLKANRSRFHFKPCVIRKWKRRIEFELQGLTNALRFSFNPRSGISIAVMWQGECWDMIGDFDVAEERTGKGWTCRLDLPEKRQYWRMREQLWIEHCFESFLAWCNDKLAQARCLAFYQLGEGSTWVRLLRDETDRDLEHRVAVITLPKGKNLTTSPSA